MARLNRRRFVQQIAVGSTVSMIGTRAGAASTNEKIHVACIGVRGRGNSLMHTFAEEPDCVVSHICDVNERTRQQRGAELKAKTGHMPVLVNDYRTLLDDPSVDAFVVATPDHWHALPTIHGCLANKDVYVEKPASHNIREGSVAVEAARKRNRIVQVGTQIRSAKFLKEAAEFVKSGGIGKVIFGRAWETARNGAVHLAPDSDPPPELDYEIWQGPAPERPYNRSIVGGAWRWLFDYGTGDLGNDGVHRIDYCRRVMGLDDWPEAVYCSGGKFFFDDDQQWPDTMIINYEYPGKILQYEMRLWSKPRLFNAGEGATVYGENGWLLITNSSWRAFDAAGKVLKEGNENMGQIQKAHVRNFLDAMRSRDRKSLNQEIESGHISTAMCHAGNISWRTGKKLQFDRATGRFTDPEANKFWGRDHRRGYELPEVG